MYLSLWRLFWRELVRRSPIKFLPVTPAPLQVRDEPNDETLWAALQLLGKHSFDYYTYRCKEQYHQIKLLHSNIPIIVYQNQHDMTQLKQIFEI